MRPSNHLRINLRVGRQCRIIYDAALRFLGAHVAEGGFPPEEQAAPNAMTTAEVLSALHDVDDGWLADILPASTKALLRSQQVDGSWTDPNSDDPWDVSNTAWAIWALLKTHHDDTSRPCAAALSWMANLILPRGGLPTNAHHAAPNTYATAYAHRAFHLAGWSDATLGCMRFLSDSQNRDGGWGLYDGAASEATLTEYVLHGLLDGGIDSQEDTVARGIQWLVSDRAADGTWGSWLDEQTSVEGTAFGLYVLAKAGLRFADAEARGIDYISRRVEDGRPWVIGDKAQLWVAVSGLLSVWACAKGFDYDG